MPQSASSDKGSISVPTLLQYLKNAEACGLAHTRLLREAGVQPDQLLDNNGRLPLSALLRLLAYVLPNCGDPLFGLQTSQFVQPGSYGVIGYIAMASNNVGEALSRIAVYERVVGDMGATHVELEPDAVVVRWDCYFEDPEVKRHVTENVLASWTVYTRWLADNPALAPVMVRLAHAAPQDPALVARYQNIFRCPVLFGQSMSALVAAPESLNHPLRQPDTTLRDTLEQHAQLILRTIDDAPCVAEQVRSLLRARLADGPVRMEHVAEQLGMNVRTLNRRLLDESLSYQQILDDLRHELAEKYLRNSDFAIEDVARRLGFAEGRSFIRYFKTRVGLTPGEFRQQLESARK